MKKVSAILIVICALVSQQAIAVYNATVTGNIVFIQQDGPNVGYAAETINFRLDNQPTVNCGSGFQQFSISSGTVSDAQTRKNMLSMLMMAKATASQVTVGYDGTGGFCDQGMPGVYYIVLR